MDKRIKDFFMRVETGIVTDAMNLLNLSGWITGIFPLKSEDKIFGPAFTLLGTRPKHKGEKDYVLYDLAEAWNKDDILVVDGKGGDYSLMGENVVHVGERWGLGGIVLNGCCRDYLQIKKRTIPVFGMGPAIELKKGKLIYTDYNIPLEISGIRINPGDYIFGDADGIVTFPSEYAEDIMYQCEMIQEVEKEIEEAINQKRPLKEIKAIVKKKTVLRVRN